MKKKIFMFVLAAAMCMSIAGCSKDSDKKETTEKKSKTTAEATTEKTTEAEIEAPEKATVVDGVYTSESFNLKLTIPDTVTQLTDAQLSQFASEQAGVVYDFGGMFDDNASSIIFMYEDMTQTIISPIDEDEYLDGLKANLTGYTSMEYEIGEIEDITVAGETYKKLTVTVSGLTQEYIIKRSGNYMFAILVTATDAKLAEAEGVVNMLEPAK